MLHIEQVSAPHPRAGKACLPWLHEGPQGVQESSQASPLPPCQAAGPQVCLGSPLGGPSGKVCSSKSAKPFCGLAVDTHHSQSIPPCERLVWKKVEEKVIPEEPEAHTGSQDQGSGRKWPRIPLGHGMGWVSHVDIRCWGNLETSERVRAWESRYQTASCLGPASSHFFTIGSFL